MLAIFRDPMWQFIGAVLALLAIVISIILYLKQRRFKSLSYEILSCTPLLSIEDEIKGDLQVTYRGNLVEQVHLIIIRIINTGNTPITTEDFERPVNISFGEEAEVFTSEIVKMKPDTIEASIAIRENRIILTPTLLNEGDELTYKTLVNKFDKININGRIIGVKEIEEYKESSLLFNVIFVLGVVVSIIGLYSFLTSPGPINFSSLSIFLAGYFLVIFSVSLNMPKERRVKILKTILKYI